MKRIINLFVNYFNIQFDTNTTRYLSGKGKKMPYGKGSYGTTKGRPPKKSVKKPIKKSKPKDK